MRAPLLFFALVGALWALEFKVASYNVENLFDLHRNGSEYEEYVPGSRHGWDKKAFETKVANIARVLCDLRPDVVGLQEIESDRALAALQRGVKRCGWPMPYRTIADRKPTAVKTALLSRYPITRKREIDPDGTLKTRDILEATLDVAGHPLTLFVNHWKSRSGPESRRIVSAKALMKRLESLPPSTEYILLGDFNSDWQEWRTLPKTPRLNDTGGITGINHILKTIRKGRSVTPRTLTPPYHYDLWLELPPQKRWSHNFYGHKSALDHMLLPASMFDGRGIDYVKGSFRPFKAYYLFDDRGAIYRWQVSDHRRGVHLNRGYSDHLPIYARFATHPYGSASREPDAEPGAAQGGSSVTEILHVADLYRHRLGWVRIRLPKVVVTYKKGPVAILKEPGGRAIAAYRTGDGLKKGRAYRVLVRKLYDYKGLREITKLEILDDLGPADATKLEFPASRLDPKNRELVGEVVREISGIYRGGYLHYGRGKKIRLYYKASKRRPKNGEKVRLKQVRVSIYRHRLELVVE
ncbi:endonuclease/exonuclease/phosphatase family protein [Hydrogenimonas sp.]